MDDEITLHSNATTERRVSLVDLLNLYDDGTKKRRSKARNKDVDKNEKLSVMSIMPISNTFLPV